MAPCVRDLGVRPASKLGACVHEISGWTPVSSASSSSPTAAALTHKRLAMDSTQTHHELLEAQQRSLPIPLTRKVESGSIRNA